MLKSVVTILYGIKLCHSHRQCCQTQSTAWKPLWRECLLFGLWVCSWVLLCLWKKNVYSFIRERWTLSCKGWPLCPAARCSVAQWVHTDWVYLLREMSTKPCWIVYIIVSIAVCLRCSRDCHFNCWIISVGLLWSRHSLCTYLAAHLCTISNLLIFCLVVESQTVEVYSRVGLTWFGSSMSWLVLGSCWCCV